MNQNKNNKKYTDDRLEQFEEREKRKRMIYYLLISIFIIFGTIPSIVLFISSLIKKNYIAVHFALMVAMFFPVGMLISVIYLDKQKKTRLLKMLDMESQEELDHFLNKCTRLEYYLYISSVRIIDIREKMVYNFDDMDSIHQEQRSASDNNEKDSERYLISFVSHSQHKLVYLSFENADTRDIAFRKISAAMKEYQKIKFEQYKLTAL